MAPVANGTFEVKLTPLSSGEDDGLDRMSIDKVFHGDLQGTSAGEMLSVATAVQGSAGYVAMEWVSGTVHGRTGRFALQHRGTMTRGRPDLVVSVVPDSGTDELEGLTGRMSIAIVDGTHSYEFGYDFESSP